MPKKDKEINNSNSSKNRTDTRQRYKQNPKKKDTLNEILADIKKEEKRKNLVEILNTNCLYQYACHYELNNQCSSIGFS